MRTIRRLPVIPVALILLAAAPLHAAGSRSNPSTARATAAVDAYNEGVRKLESADAIGMKKSATYSYDYAAAPDGKALREYEQAVAEFTRAISLQPDMKEAHNYLGYCYRRLGKLVESLASYDRAIDLDPDFAQAHEYRGKTYLALGQLEQAQAELAVLQGLKSKYAEYLARSIAVYQDREARSGAKAGGK
jgi:tetratricopeptide (TPR) repeat protein